MTTERARITPVEQGDNTVTRRDVVKGAAKVGAAGIAIAWIAPKFESVAYAADSTGSPTPTSSSSTSTTDEDNGEHPTCEVDPKVLRAPRVLPFRIRVIGTRWAPSSKVTVSLVGVKVLGTITTQPNGAFDTRVEVPAGVKDGKYEIEMTGFDAKGKRHQCFEDFRIAVGGSGETTTTAEDPDTDSKSGSGVGSASGSGSGSGNGSAVGSNGAGQASGTLPFTGTDSRTLLLVGAGAVVAGRSLYGLRNRIATASADGDAHSR